MLHRRNLNVQGGQVYIMCNIGELETIEHLFFNYPFAKECWQKISFDWEENMELSNRLIRGQVMHNNPCFFRGKSYCMLGIVEAQE
jgi:hypothetical protein